MANLQELDEAIALDLVYWLFVENTNIQSVEKAAQLFVEKLCASFMQGGKSDLILARVFHSLRYSALPDDVQRAARNTVGSAPADDSLFLTLLGTYGDEAAWQHRTRSAAHQAIPLTHESIAKIPMMSRLFQQIGFDLGLVLGEGSPGIRMSGIDGSYGMFHIQQAEGSPYIPAQDFVKKYGVKSVIGGGVRLPNKEIGIFIGFSRVPIIQGMCSGVPRLMSLFWSKTLPLIDKGFFS